tara:strand:+ start:206 stop:481 length:276 start_codon:yes stop_codon:yes gene_type:complete
LIREVETDFYGGDDKKMRMQKVVPTSKQIENVIKSDHIEKLVNGKITPKQEDFEFMFYYMLEREVELIRMLNSAKDFIDALASQHEEDDKK